MTVIVLDAENAALAQVILQPQGYAGGQTIEQQFILAAAKAVGQPVEAQVDPARFDALHDQPDGGATVAGRRGLQGDSVDEVQSFADQGEL